MSTLAVLVLVLAVVATAALVAALVVTVRHDGYGTLVPPRSHLDDGPPEHSARLA